MNNNFNEKCCIPRFVRGADGGINPASVSSSRRICPAPGRFRFAHLHPLTGCNTCPPPPPVGFYPTTSEYSLILPVHVVVLVFLLLFLTVNAFAQDGGAVNSGVAGGVKKAAIGLGPEWNMNARENFAGGAVLAFDYTIGSSFAVGVTATVSSNFSGIIVLEPAALLRWYFLSKKNSGLFVQADAGAYLVLEDEEVIPLFSGGLRAGFRLPLGARLFIEPFGRMGYPFAFGVGAMAGMKF